MPREVADFELMRYMRWTWRDLQETPVYVLRYCRDLMGARLRAEQEHADRERRRAR
jgi:hypothetical protein